MKLLIGDGKVITVRDVSDIIYVMEAKENLMLPLHGFKIMKDDEAREFITNNKHLSNNIVVNE